MGPLMPKRGRLGCLNGLAAGQCVTASGVRTMPGRKGMVGAAKPHTGCHTLNSVVAPVYSVV